MSSTLSPEGPWRPMRKQMPAPGTGVLVSPRLSLCFNESWQPAVLSALKMLTRPEVWAGDLIDVKATVMEAHTLMGSVGNECIDLPQFVMELDPTDPANTTTQVFSIATEDYPSLLTKVYLFVCAPVLSGGVGHIRLRLKEYPSGTLCGANWRLLKLIAPANYTVWSLLYDPCIGSDFADSSLGDQYTRNNEVLWKVTIEASKPFVGLAVVDSAIECASA